MKKLFIYIFLNCLLSNHIYIDLITTNDIHGVINEQTAYFMNPEFPPNIVGGAAFYKYVKDNQTKNLHCILIDEVQFLSKDQVIQIGKVTDTLNVPAMCYGIRTDFRGELFEGSKYLLALADNLVELKTVCSMCSRKAIMVVRLNQDGKVLTEGQKIQIGGNETYQVVCRKHFRSLTKLI